MGQTSPKFRFEYTQFVESQQKIAKDCKECSAARINITERADARLSWDEAGQVESQSAVRSASTQLLAQGT